MKHLLSIILSIITFTIASSVAIASDMPSAATDTTKQSALSAPSEVTTPVELLKPEVAIDRAINTPKNKEEQAVDEYGANSTVANSTVVEKKDTEYKKPAYKTKKIVKHHKKHQDSAKHKKHKTRAKKSRNAK